MTFPRERLKVRRMDCDLAVSVLCNQARRARHEHEHAHKKQIENVNDVPAGTFEGA